MESSESNSEISSGDSSVVERGRGRGRRRGRGARGVGHGSERGGRGGERGGRGGERGGRGRGRAGVFRGGRGRGRRGRGSATPALQASDKERIKQLWIDRKADMKELVQQMEEQRLRDLVVALIDREPALVFDLCEEQEPTPPGSPPAQPQQAPSWCTCGNCQEMGADLDNKCCGCLPRNCVSRRYQMERLVLDPEVLALGNRYYREMMGRHAQQIEDYHKWMRYAAYRHFTLWRHGRLGAGVRRVIPSCCVMVIRDHYPSPTGHYTGFVPNRYV